MKRNKIIYNPHLSIAENASNNKVTESAIRKYIRINGIDRLKDNATILERSIKELRKKNPDITIAEICRLLNKSRNTVKKYIIGDKKVSNIDTKKVSTLDLSKRKFIVSSVSDDQNEILYNILKLHIHRNTFDCDMTFSKGVFYRKISFPPLKFDKYPQSEDVKQLDEVYNIPNASLFSIVIDLPFVIKGDNAKYESMMADRFNCFKNINELYSTNAEMLQLAYSKLQKGGFLIFKTMDLRFGGNQHWVCNFVQNKANEIGFKLIDLFILIAKNKVLTTVNKIQKSARKFHSYFFVFRKVKNYTLNVEKMIYFLDFDGTIAKTDILKQGKDWKDSQKYIPQIEIYPRAIQFIKEEQRKGNEIYIVSGNVGSTIVKTLEYFNIPIPKERVYGYRFGYPMENLKRKIRVIQEALKTVEDKKKIIYIGDEVDDFRACRELGIKFESEMFSVE